MVVRQPGDFFLHARDRRDSDVLGDQRRVHVAERAVRESLGRSFVLSSSSQALLHIVSSLFGEHLLAGLRSIEHIFLILRKQAQEPEALTLSEDAVVSILGIVQSACGVAA